MIYDEISDAAIASHDRQREFPPEAHDALFDGLTLLLRDRAPCLDAGTGTGSIALPLLERGVSLVGIDISRAMLAALQAKTGEQAPLPLVRGDLARLPFADDAFAAAIAANVFHVIPAWRVALDELFRVVRSRGLLLFNLGSTGTPTKATRLVTKRFYAMLHDDTITPIGPRDAAEFHEELVMRGAIAKPSLEIRFQQTVSLDDIIARLEHNVFSRPATIDQDQASRAAATVRRWAHGEFGSLDVMQESERTLTVHIYELP